MVLDLLKGTCEYDILLEMENCYNHIKKEQDYWYEKSGFTCPSGCGSCCVNFEPHLLKSEMLYLAAWILENKKDLAMNIMDGQFPFNHEKTCLFFSPDDEYHCSVYGGRPSICRLFGASCSKNQKNETVWKPCKFYPTDLLKKYNPFLDHKQFSRNQVEEFFSSVPPVMSDCMEGVFSLNQESISQTALIRQQLPLYLQKLSFIISLNS